MIAGADLRIVGLNAAMTEIPATRGGDLAARRGTAAA